MSVPHGRLRNTAAHRIYDGVNGSHKQMINGYVFNFNESSTRESNAHVRPCVRVKCALTMHNFFEDH